MMFRMAGLAANRRPYLADATDLEQWADRMMARSDLARLVRSLIAQTNDQVVSLEMRAGAGSEVPGYDGLVEATAGTPFVPKGRSVWELGTGEDPRKKASEDYKSRTDDPLGIDQAETTFVFVTPRREPKKNDWIAERQKNSPWKDIKFFDVDNIELALEQAPGVHFAFSDQIGKPAYGVQNIDAWWKRFATGSNPVLTAEMVLAGRQEDAASFLRLLQQDIRRTTISAASADDVLTFVAATILSIEEENHRLDLIARTLFVRDAHALRMLDSGAKLLILLPYDEGLHREAQLIRSHHLVFLAPRDVPADITLRPLEQQRFADLLRAVGVNDDRARDLARAAARSFVAFQRVAAAPGQPPLRPEWTTWLRSQSIRRAWLAGGWTQLRSGDLDAMSALLGRVYGEAQPELREASNEEDPLFTVVGEVWGVASPEATWDFVRPQLTAADLSALEQVLQTVLGAVDPALELPVEDRWQAAIYGKSRLHSSNLRTGLATSLALLGALGDSLSLGGGATGRTWAERSVAQLLRRANEDASGQLWASLSDVLPLLSEAAPDYFLGAVQKGVSGSDPVLAKIFLDQANTFTISSPHAGLLWALEGVARSAEHLGLAAELLARLAELDPGGRLANRPANSLVDIVRPWLPQTLARPATRVAVVESIASRHPEVGWSLLMSLLPQAHMVGSYTHTPRFRSWKKVDERVPPQEYWQMVGAVSDLLLKTVETKPERWPALIERLPDLPGLQRAEAYGRLSSLADASEVDPEFKLKVWGTLADLGRQHRSYKGAVWALPDADLDRIDEIVAKLLPQDPVENSAWLFDSRAPDIGIKRTDDFAAHDKAVAQERSKAMRAIAEGSGIEGIHRLVDSAKEPYVVGWTAADAEILINEDAVLADLESTDGQRSSFAMGFVQRRVDREAIRWIDQTIPRLTGRPLAQARVLRALTDLHEAWERLAQLGQPVEEAYWKEFVPYGRGPDFPLVAETTRHLLEHKRPHAAIDLLSMYLDRSDPAIEVELVADALEDLVDRPPGEQRGVPSYEVQHLLDYLRASSFNDDRLAVLEWRLLPGLGYGVRSPVLERRLARDPNFFIEVLSLCFKRADGSMEKKVQKEVAENAYRLLNEWRTVPGSADRGATVDEAALNKWLDEAHRLLTEADRLEIGDVWIGHVFAHAKQDEDGTWPTLPVRNAIEALAQDEVGQGFQTETFNKRGVVSRGLTDGGKQEYQLASQFDGWAAKISDRWPRTAAVLRSLAETYMAEGRALDEEARRVIEGLD